MKKLFVIILLSAVTLIRIGYADDTLRRALAEELLVLMNTKENIERSFEIIKEMQKSQLQQMNVPGKESFEKAQAIREKVMDLISQELSWDKLKDDYITVYADTFSEKELEGIINFYKTPVGKKFTEKTPELMKKSMDISQKQMQELMPKLQSITKGMLEELEEAIEKESLKND
ncbi:MAG: DUF2059 domain-containing protein [Candidatus Omnitrophica bacterium]|nr:DUF2059 domain-containing protein [Candidatus Omnitrophota bacterium]